MHSPPATILQPILRAVRGTMHLFLAACTMLLLGCEPPPRPPVKGPAAAEKRSQNPAPRGAELPQSSLQERLRGNVLLEFNVQIPIDLWDAYYIQGNHVGYSHLHVEPTEKQDEVRYTVTERLRYRQGTRLIDSELVQTALETNAGRLKSFTASYRQGEERSSVEGTVRGNEILISSTIGQEQVTRTVPWSPNYGGLFALEQQLLESHPASPGEKISLKVLAPVVYEVGELEMEAMGKSMVSFVSGKNELLTELEIRSAIAGNPNLVSYAWVDEEGRIKKRFIPSVKLFVERTSEEIAKNIPDPTAAAEETGPSARYPYLTLSLDKAIERPLELVLCGFQVRTTEPLDVASQLEGIPEQFVLRQEKDAFRLAVGRGRTEGVSAPPPDSGDREPGPIIQSDHPAVQQLALSAAQVDARGTVKELARLTREKLRVLEMQGEFLTASEALEQGRGDSTEHAVLLAALCRVQGIPSRVIAGLVYEDGELGPQMRYQMWTLVYLEGNWVHVDSMLLEPFAPADRFGIVSDDLSSGLSTRLTSDLSLLIPKLRLTLAGVKYAPEVDAP